MNDLPEGLAGLWLIERKPIETLAPGCYIYFDIQRSTLTQYDFKCFNARQENHLKSVQDMTTAVTVAVRWVDNFDVFIAQRVENYMAEYERT